jgi:GntR family transcriptional regulator
MSELRLTVDPADPTPPYEQLRRQLADLIGAGVLGAGERLPPLRQLAGDLGLAVGTVARAYRELEAEGLLASKRGGGTRVSAQPPKPSAGRDDRLAGLATDFVTRARALGSDDAAIAAAVRKVLG